MCLLWATAGVAERFSDATQMGTTGDFAHMYRAVLLIWDTSRANLPGTLDPECARSGKLSYATKNARVAMSSQTALWYRSRVTSKMDLLSTMHRVLERF